MEEMFGENWKNWRLSSIQGFCVCMLGEGEGIDRKHTVCTLMKLWKVLNNPNNKREVNTISVQKHTLIIIRPWGLW